MIATPDIRDGLKLVMEETVSAEMKGNTAHYREVRPEPLPTRPWTFLEVWYGDCSTGTRDLCWWVPGCPDPMDNDWDGYGNSSTIWIRLHHADISEAECGDIVTFGFFAGERHAAMIYEPGVDPLLWNFGRPGEPIFSRLSTERANHPGMTVTLCKLPVPDPPPTPVEKLKAMTGFYAWLSWRLGEGPWKRYGVRNKTVRPAVPRRISAAWWVHYARYMRNRRKPNKQVK